MPGEPASLYFMHIMSINDFYSYSGSERCLELLCKYYGSKIVHLEDSRKRRPLHIAACHGHLDCVRYLLEEGAVTEVYDDQGRTPLIVAAQNGHSSVIGT